VVLVGVAGCGQRTPDPAPFAAGSCLREPVETDHIHTAPRITLPGVSYRDATPTFCTDTRSFAKILKVVRTASDCPLESDTTFTNFGDTACARNLTAWHEGDAGNGGGLLRIGDCMAVDLDDDGKALNVDLSDEMDCSAEVPQGHVKHKIVAAVARVSGCAKGLTPYGKDRAGLPKAVVGDYYPERDWPSSYSPVLCLKRVPPPSS